MQKITTFLTLFIVIISSYVISAQSHYLLQGLSGNLENPQIAESDDGSTYLAVQYTDTLVFSISPDSMVKFLPIDSFNVCVLKLDEDGAIEKSFRFASTYRFRQRLLTNLIIGHTGQVILTGAYVTSLVTEHRDTLIPNIIGDAFVMNLDSELQTANAYYFGGANNGDEVIDMRVTPLNRILLAGKINGFQMNDSVDVDLKEGVVKIGANPSGGPFIASYTESLDLIWASSLPQIKNNFVQGVVGDYTGNSYMMIRLQDTFDLTFGADTVRLEPMDLYDLLLMKWDSSGQFVDYKVIRSSSQDTYLGMDVDHDNNLQVFFKNRGKSIQVNRDTVFSDASLRMIWMKIAETGAIVQQKEVAFSNQLAGGIAAVTAQNELIVADLFTGGDGFDFDQPGEYGDGFGRKIFIAWYNTNGEYLRSRTILEGMLDRFEDLNIGNSGHLSWIAQTGNAGEVFLYPGPQGSIELAPENFVIARSCVPIDENAQLTIACNNGLHELETTGASFQIFEDQVLLAEGESAQVELPDTILAIISDAAGCPVYQEIFVDSCESIISSVDLDQPNDITIYPNPVSSTLYIDAGETIQQVKILNSWGQVVYQVRQVRPNQSLDLGDLTPGIYFLDIFIDDKTRQTSKLVKY